MSTIEQTQQGVPTGTWKADTVHSRVAFEVPYAVATFSSTYRPPAARHPLQLAAMRRPRVRRRRGGRAR